MVRYIISRIVWTIPVLLLAILMTFALIHLIPGNPIAHQIQNQSPSTTRNLEHKYGLDQPFWKQYVLYVWHLVHWNWGLSSQDKNQTVWAQLATDFPASIKLVLMAFIVAMFIGVPAGIASALRANGIVDHGITILTTLFFAVPTVVTAPLWVTYFPSHAGWDTWSQRIGPVTVLGVALIAYFTRLLRASMIESLQQEFVVTARAKGLSRRVTIIRHVLRNSLVPMITNFGPLLAYTITGAFITETVFAVPGIAFLFVSSVEAKDYDVVLGTTVALTCLIIVLNLVVDIVIGFLDPRIAHD